MDRAEIKRLARARLQDAKVLYQAKRYHGAIYLCGYAVEMALKARICQTLRWTEYKTAGEVFRFLRTHNLEALLSLSGVEEAVRLNNDHAWSVATSWSEQHRYQPLSDATEPDAKALIDAAATLVRVLIP